jgi:threonine dehydrogenase-like Zn-dependent dehydrogenase
VVKLSDFYLGTELAIQHADLIAPMITHTFSLDQVDKAFATAEDKSTRSIKVQVHHSQDASTGSARG